MTDYLVTWQRHLSTNDAPEVPLYSAPMCGWCHTAPALEDGFCSRMCRVESWKAGGDDSDFQGEPRIAEALANPEIARARTMQQIAQYHRERAS